MFYLILYFNNENYLFLFIFYLLYKMPYDITEISPGKFVVVNKKTDKQYGKKPISLKNAKAQLRILEKNEKITGGGEEQLQYQEYMKSHLFGDLENAIDLHKNDAEVHKLYEESAKYKKILGGSIDSLLVPSSLEKPFYDAEYKKYAHDVLNLYEPGLSPGKLKELLRNRLPAISGKAKAIMNLRQIIPPPKFDYNAEQQQYIGF